MFIFRLCLFVFLFLVTVEATDELKKTGQVKVYQKYDDGTYQKGIIYNFIRDDIKEIVLDNRTNLMWQDTVDVKIAVKKKNLLDAVQYCNSLILGEYDDWRLSNITELRGLIDYSQSNVSIHKIFKNTAADRYWSKTASHSQNGSYWWVSFDFSEISIEDKSTLHYTRCVREVE